MMLPFFIKDSSLWHGHCLAVSPSLVLSLMFIILYFVDQVHDLAEQLYLLIQLTFNLGAMIEALLSSNTTNAFCGLFYCHLAVALAIDYYYVVKVVALVLNLIPHIVAPVEALHCLVAAPTLMLSLIFLLLYIVDQVLAEAEMYYVVCQLFLSAVALIVVFLGGRPAGAIYGLFYTDLIIAFSIDLYFIVKQRGWTV